MTPRSLFELISVWHHEAEVLRRCGAVEAGITSDLRAEELERWLRASDAEPLELAQAVLESGYPRAHLRRMIREDQLPNAGSDAKPLILRAHLPRKPGAGIATAARLMPSSRTQVARAVASQGSE